MRKFSILLALLAGMMLPVTAFAQNADSTKQETISKYKDKKSSSKKDTDKKTDKKKKEEEKPVVVENELNEQQVMLNNEAFKAKDEGKLETAEQIFKSMLLLGEYNIIWLNLAGTYLEQNKCMETAEALEHVYTAPRITNVPHEDIVARAEDYAAKLKQKCSATISIKCDPADTTVSLDGGQPMACNPSAITLVPGRHSIYGKTSFGFTNVDFNVNEYETKDVEVTVINYEQVALEAGVTPEKLREKSRLFKIMGYSFLGVGAVAAAVGFGINGYYYFNYDSESTSARTDKDRDQPIIHAGLAIGIIGAAMLVTGVTLVVYDRVKFQPQIEELEKKKLGFTDFRISPAISPEFSGLAFSGSF